MTNKNFIFVSVMLALSLVGFGMAAVKAVGQQRDGTGSGLVLGDHVGTWMSDETCSVGSHIVFGYTDRGVPVLRCEQDLSPL